MLDFDKLPQPFHAIIPPLLDRFPIVLAAQYRAQRHKQDIFQPVRVLPITRGSRMPSKHSFNVS
jgi:hypothetical protein